MIGESSNGITGPVVGIADHTGGSGVTGVATTGSGVQGTATSGNAVYGVATAGYGVVAEGDTTSPAKCAFRIVPQDTLPTNALVGDLCVVSGKLNICTVSHTTTPTFVVVGDQTA